MAGPSFIHLTGRQGWRACADRSGLEIDARSAALRLRTDQEDQQHDPVSPALWQARRAQRGGALWIPLPPDVCPAREIWRGGPNGVERHAEGRWRPVPDLTGQPCLALDADDTGVIWALVGAPETRRLRRRDARDGAPLESVEVPTGLTDFALCKDGLLGIDERRLWWHVEGAWREIADARALGDLVFLNLTRWGDGALALVRGEAGCELWVVRRGQLERGSLTGLLHGSSLLALPGGDALVGELVLVPGSNPATTRARFARYRRPSRPGEPWERVDAWQIIGHDGVGLALDPEGHPWGTSARGPRRLVPRPDVYVGEGSSSQDLVVRGLLLTRPLDAGIPATPWHRVFLDLALPEGTGVRVRALVSDRPLDPASPPDTSGWPDLQHLDRRPARADRPFPVPRRPPAEEAIERVDDPRELVEFETFEGLLPNAPGRYLHLAVELLGTRRASPTLVGLRATFPRPSLLGLLPAWWREDPEEKPPCEGKPDQRDSARLERLLALFEGPLTELEDRLDALPRLWDPAATPAEVLPWLASLIGWTLDERLGEEARRALLLEGCSLHRARGTLRGIERLVKLLGGCEVSVVEGFRLRRRGGGRPGVEAAEVHDVQGAVLGPGLVLADDDGLNPAAWYRATAHRLLVLLHRARDPEITGLIEQALAAYCPAHVAFEVHFGSDGLRPGLTSELGLVTLDRSEQDIGVQPMIIGEEGTPLGVPDGQPPTVLPHPALDFTSFPGPPPGLHRSTP